MFSFIRFIRNLWWEREAKIASLKTLNDRNFEYDFFSEIYKYSNSQIPKHIEHVILSFSACGETDYLRIYFAVAISFGLALSFLLICIIDSWFVYVCDSVCACICVLNVYTMRLCMRAKGGERTVNVNSIFNVLDFNMWKLKM